MFGAIAARGVFVRSALLIGGGVVVGTTYHCGKVSSQRMCLRLQVLQPFRDLVWLLRGGPPPGPAIVTIVKMRWR